MINLGNGKYRSLEEINHALRLEELVKEKIKECKRNAGGMVYGMALESLIKESEK